LPPRKRGSNFLKIGYIQPSCFSPSPHFAAFKPRIAQIITDEHRFDIREICEICGKK